MPSRCLLVTLALTVTACGGSSAEPGVSATTTVADVAASTAPQDPAAAAPSEQAVVPDILRFTAPLLGGGTFDGASLANTPTVFWFWAPT